MRATSTERPETGPFTRGSRRLQSNVGRLSKRHWANRTAVHSGGENAGEEPPVKAAVTAVNGLPADRRIDLRLLAKGTFLAAKCGGTFGHANTCRHTLP